MIKRRAIPSGDLSSRFPEFADILDHVLIHSATQNPKAVADDLGIAAQTLYSYTEGNRRFPAELIVPLVLSTNDHRILSWIAEQVGAVCYPLPSHVTGDRCVPVNSEVMRLLCLAQREHCHAIEEVSKGLADGAINASELPLMLSEINEAIEALLTLRDAATAAAKGVAP